MTRLLHRYVSDGYNELDRHLSASISIDADANVVERTAQQTLVVGKQIMCSAILGHVQAASRLISFDKKPWQVQDPREDNATNFDVTKCVPCGDSSRGKSMSKKYDRRDVCALLPTDDQVRPLFASPPTTLLLIVP